MSEEEILDYPARLFSLSPLCRSALLQGVEYADVVEALARRRCAELFATEKISASQLYVNVQPLSGGPANNAVYTALLNPANHSGYEPAARRSSQPRVRRQPLRQTLPSHPLQCGSGTEQIDYDQMEALAREHKPKIIIAGFHPTPGCPIGNVTAPCRRCRCTSAGGYLPHRRTGGGKASPLRLGMHM